MDFSKNENKKRPNQTLPKLKTPNSKREIECQETHHQNEAHRKMHKNSNTKTIQIHTTYAHKKRETRSKDYCRGKGVLTYKISHAGSR